MFPKISWIFILLIGTIQFVTSVTVPCTPEMDTKCKKFCESTTYPMYCRVGRLTIQCRQILEGATKKTSCSKKFVTDMCLPFREMFRCQDEALLCNCKRAERTQDDGCFTLEKDNTKIVHNCSKYS